MRMQGTPAPLLPCPHPFPAASAPPTVPHLLHLLTCLRYRTCMPRVCKRHPAHVCEQGSTRNICVGVEAVRMGAQSVRMSMGIPRACVSIESVREGVETHVGDEGRVMRAG